MEFAATEFSTEKVCNLLHAAVLMLMRIRIINAVDIVGDSGHHACLLQCNLT